MTKVMTFAGAALLLGTAGAGDIGQIGLAQELIQIGVALLIIGAGYLIRRKRKNPRIAPRAPKA